MQPVIMYKESYQQGEWYKGADKQGGNMREYRQDGMLQNIICNGCGRKLEATGSVIRNDWLSVDKAWGYFSEKDGCIHSFDLCEECYDNMIHQFAVEVTQTQQNEMI